MNVLVVGNGAREHAIVWKLLQSPKTDEVYVAPGNAGTALIARNLDISPTDFESLVEAAREHNVGLVVVGPEAPLATGAVDLFKGLGIPAFGPTKQAARIESSKVFSKDLMQRYGIPCARSAAFSSLSEARTYVVQQPTPLVVKADGLAAGKGVIIANTTAEALDALSEIMEKRAFGAAGDRVIVEEFLTGREVSLLALTDGKTVIPMVPACDYKRVFDDDKGPNTGGMGAYSPPKFFTTELQQQVQRTILEPTVRALEKEGCPYKGVLYAGLMITRDGPKVLEFNARFGDPETQVILPRLESDLVEIMLAVINGHLDKARINWSDEACVGVVVASAGYPGTFKTGFPIEGFDRVDKGVIVFHAGTRLDGSSNEGPAQVLTNGGRVLTVVARGSTVAEARNKVYINLPCLHFEGNYYRTDIAAVEEA